MKTAQSETRSSREGILRQLKTAGYSIHSFSVASIGEYALADADWNYKDVPHLNIVHSKVRAIIGTMGDDVITTLNLQKIFGIPVPLTLVNYATSETAQTYFTTLGPYVLVVHTSYENTDERTTTVTTNYNIAAAGIARVAFPLLEKILRGNYKTLMSEDLPMRTRRGELRARGFGFASDGRPRTFVETTDLTVANVVPPAREDTEKYVVMRRELEATKDVLVGRDDDCGVRLMLKENTILVFPRYCNHEGASLDCAVLKNKVISCPWHAKAVPALASVSLVPGTTQRFGVSEIVIGEHEVHVTLPAASTALESAR